MFFISDFWSGFRDGLVEFYETEKVLAIFVGISSIVFMTFVFVCCIKGLYHSCKRICNRTRKYRITKKNAKNEPTERYEAIELDEFQPRTYPYRRDEDEQSNPRSRTKVMLTDKYGNIPSYTLRTRSMDGSPDKYTSYYTYRVVKETDL